MKKTNVFRASAVAITVISIAVISIVACSKANSETAASQSSTKDMVYPPGAECYYYEVSRLDTCANILSHWPLGDFCYIDLVCLLQYDDPVYPGLLQINNDGNAVVLCLYNYSHGNDKVEQLFEKYFEAGEITFTSDCPAGTPELMEYLPEGYLPAGSYPISKHGIDAWIDITSAVQ